MKTRRNADRKAVGGARARSQIPGVVVTPLDRFTDPRGWLTELHRDDKLPKGLRPAMSYISMTKPGQSRGPHEHRRQTDLFCFIGPGDFQIWLWDNRKKSATYGCRETFRFGASDPAQIIIPPGVVHAYRNVSKYDAVCFNAPDKLYRGRGKRSAVDEIRHEDDPASPFTLD